MKDVKVLIVDDHPIFRDGLFTFLNSLPNVTVVAEASDGEQAIQKIKTNKIDLVFMDIRMPKMNGIESTRKIRAKYPHIKIIALTMFSEKEYFDQMIYAGIDGFLLKNTEHSDLLNAIDAVRRGRNYYQPELLKKIYGKSSVEVADVKKTTNLTRRENDVLQLICKGLSNQEIADELFISQRTVQGHRANLISKTKSKNSIDLVMYAVKNKLFTP